MGARLDVPNQITTNGELHVQASVLDLYDHECPLIVLDIGANVGDWAQPLLDEVHRRRLTNLELHAFEPVPETFTVLSNRLQQHPLQRHLHLACTAVSSRQGTAQMSIYQRLGGTNSLYADPLMPEETNVSVETTTVDAYCAANEIRTIHLMKSDTEGHDMEVLRGAERLFDEERIMVCQFEYNHRWVFARHYLKDVFDFVAKGPYKVCKITPQRVEVYSAWHPELERFFESNWLLLHPKALRGFSVLAGSFDVFNTFGAG
jgi:FkbM family methyltransferase